MEVGSLTGRVSSDRMQVAVIIPARDEQGTIGEVVAGARRALPGARLIVVDDASRDGTARIGRDQGAEVVSLRRRAGYAGALHAGYREAMCGPVGAVLQMDGDGQHRPGDLPGLLDGLARADIVLGSRFLGPSPGYRIPRLRRAGMAACRWMAQAGGGIAVTDPTSGLRAMSAAAAAHIAERGFPRGLTETSMLIHMHREGFRIEEIPVLMRESTSQSMHAGLAGGAHFLRISWAVAGLRAGRRPVPARGPEHPATDAVVPRNAL
jgi:hypothetical protein